MRLGMGFHQWCDFQSIFNQYWIENNKNNSEIKIMIKKAFLRVIIREYLNMWWFVLLIVDVYFIIYFLFVLSLVLSMCARNDQDLNKMYSFIFFNFCFKEINLCIGVGLHKNKAITEDILKLCWICCFLKF